MSGWMNTFYWLSIMNAESHWKIYVISFSNLT